LPRAKVHFPFDFNQPGADERGAETRAVNPRRKKGILTSPAKSASMNEVTSSW
jgi:hypothetical protein